MELSQAWATAPLVNAATGQTFRIADYAGRVIIIETMAIWCANCKAQQIDVETVLGRLPADSVVYLVLDVDPNENAQSLAAYREQTGFTGDYAIAGNEVARSLAAEFGDQVLNPPSTPVSWWDGTAADRQVHHQPSPHDRGRRRGAPRRHGPRRPHRQLGQHPPELRLVGLAGDPVRWRRSWLGPVEAGTGAGTPEGWRRGAHPGGGGSRARRP